MNATTPNISLQRTAPCGLAAELGSFGGRGVGFGLFLLLSVVTFFVQPSSLMGSEVASSWEPPFATVSLSHGLCGECGSWSIAIIQDMSAMVTVRDSNSALASENRYELSADDENVRSLIDLLNALDPAERSRYLLDAESLQVFCSGGLFIDRTLARDDIGSVLWRIRALGQQLVQFARTRAQGHQQ